MHSVLRATSGEFYISEPEWLLTQTTDMNACHVFATASLYLQIPTYGRALYHLCHVRDTVYGTRDSPEILSVYIIECRNLQK